MQYKEERVIIIGSGLAGLSAACVLGARGHRVTLLEANEWLGGKAAQLNADTDAGRFRFDMGPTILTVPRVLERIFEEANESVHDHLDLIRLDPQWRCFFDETVGGGVLDLREDPQQMRDTLQAFLGSGEAPAPSRRAAEQRAAQQTLTGYDEFQTYAERLHDISDRFYFWKPIGRIGDMFQASGSFNLKTLQDVFAMRMHSTVADTIRKHVPEPRVAQMLDHYTQYVGSSPYGSPAILCGIASMQSNDGVWYPRGGTRAVPEALIALAERHGVELRTGVKVERIKHDGDRVTGVVTKENEQLSASAVVSNMDAVRTHRELLGGEITRRFERERDYEPACSGIVLYLGLDRGYDHLAHHDFIFSRDPEEEFDAIYEQGEPAPDPTCYLAAPARTEAPGQVAPEGGEALYVLVHTPFLRPHHDWSKEGAFYRNYREIILRKLETTGRMPDLRERIVFEEALTPQDIHDRYRVLNGAIYGLASHGRLGGGFKPINRHRDLRGLYLAGGAAHPGPGMPMVMMSGWIAADALHRDAN